LLFKTGIILCLFFIILSFFLPAEAPQAGKEQGRTVGMLATAAAFGSFLQDIDGFCARNPQSCETGKSFFNIMAEKAQQGASFAYQWLGSGLHKGAENTGHYLAKQEKSRPQAGSSPGSAASSSSGLKPKAADKAEAKAARTAAAKPAAKAGPHKQSAKQKPAAKAPQPGGKQR